MSVHREKVETAMQKKRSVRSPAKRPGCGLSLHPQGVLSTFSSLEEEKRRGKGKRQQKSVREKIKQKMRHIWRKGGWGRGVFIRKGKKGDLSRRARY